MIPEELKKLDRFVCYNKDKLPFDAKNGKPASSTDSSTWSSFYEALAGKKKYNLRGVGFVLGDGYAGIDIDQCVGKQGICEEAQWVMEKMDSYAELSPSGTGIHILFKGVKPGPRCKTKNIEGAKEIEIYDSGRYFTLTGKVARGRQIEERQEELEEVYRKYFGGEARGKQVAERVVERTFESLDNRRSLEIGLQKDKKLASFYQGSFDMSDESAKDMALMGKLMYWTNNDTELAIEAFLESPFAKGKDDKHQKKLERQDYLQRTAAAATSSSTAAEDNRKFIVRGIRSTKDNWIAEMLKELQPHERYSFDDKGNGDLFAEVFREIARFNTTAKEWYVYNGKVWQQDVGTMLVSRMAKQLKDELLMFSLSIKNDSQKTAYQKHIVKLGSRPVRDTMVKDARDRYCISNDDLDQDPDLLNCQNGTLNLRTFRFREHRSSDLLSRIAAAEYEPEIRSTLWERFIDDVMEGNQSKMEYLQKAIGYGITSDTSLETCFILYGAQTRNGKSTMMETIMHMLGGSRGYSLQMKPESLAQKQTVDSRQASGDIARLQGARFLNVSEPPKKMIFDVALLKTLLGRDSIVARHLHEREFEFTPIFKLFMNTNYLPIIGDDTLFASGRINVITFDRKFSEEEQDKTLKNKLQSKENLSGILNWCLDGLKAFYRDGLVPSKAIAEATAEYRSDSDKMGKFIAECLEEADENLTAGSLYDVYEEWCRRCGYGCENQGNFYAELRTKNLMSKTGTVGGKTKQNVVKGYRVTSEYRPFGTYP